MSDSDVQEMTHVKWPLEPWVVAGIGALALVLLSATVIVIRQLGGGSLHPSGIYIESISVGEDATRIAGGTLVSSAAYRGYSSSVDDGVLSVGLKYSLFLGHTGDFAISVPNEGQRIHKVVLVGEGGELVVYPPGPRRNRAHPDQIP